MEKCYWCSKDFQAREELENHVAATHTEISRNVRVKI